MDDEKEPRNSSLSTRLNVDDDNIYIYIIYIHIYKHISANNNLFYYIFSF